MGNVILPIDSYCFRGVAQPPTRGDCLTDRIFGYSLVMTDIAKWKITMETVGDLLFLWPLSIVLNESIWGMFHFFPPLVFSCDGEQW